jgi:PadR family transcriptional regulator, regulatory protein AphA
MSVDHIILGVISLFPCSGYDMKAEFEKGTAGMLSALSFGSIYPRLKHLEREGLIETQQISADGRHKKVYELTTRGWLELMQWLEQPAAFPIPMHDELLLKMLFWGSADSDRGMLIKHLQERREESQELRGYLDEWQRNGVSFVDEYGSLILSYMQMRLEAELQWIDKAVAQLEGPVQLPTQDPKWLAVLQKSRRSKALGLQEDEQQEEGEKQPEQHTDEKTGE